MEPFGGKDALKRLSCFFTASLPLHTPAYTEKLQHVVSVLQQKIPERRRMPPFSLCLHRQVKKTIIRINLLIAMLLVFKQFG